MASDSTLSVVIHDNLESLDSLRPEWDRLLGEYALSTTFSTYEWLAPWWRAFGTADRLLVLAFRDASAALVGLAPMAVTTRRAFPVSLRVLRMMGDGTHDSDNLDCPVRPGYEDAFTCGLLDWMEQNFRLWDVCELNTLPADSSIGAKLFEALAKRHWNCLPSTRPRTVVELAESWEAHLRGISSKERGKIGLRARRLNKKYEVRIRRCSEETEIGSMLAALFELHGKHWRLRGLPGTLDSGARRQFYTELAPLLLSRRRLEFWVLEADGKIVAVQFGLRHGTTVFSLQEGFDPSYSADSVGYVLRSQVLKQLIAEGVRRYDFLGGNDDSKMRWGGEVKHYLNIQFARPFGWGNLYIRTKSANRQTKDWLRRHLPAAVWTGLKGAIVKKAKTGPAPEDANS